MVGTETELTLDETIARLCSLRASRANSDDASQEADVAACTEAVNTLFALSEAGAKTSAEVLDILFDYKALAKQYQALYGKYIQCVKPTLKDGAWYCSSCNHRVSASDEFCSHCGKKLGWF